GGLGTRFGEYKIPKPLITVGKYPIIFHIMQLYSHYKHNDFIICLGYEPNHFKELFHQALKEFDGPSEDWNIIFVETPPSYNVGQRLKTLEPYIQPNELFMAAYGDNICDVNLDEYVQFFNQHSAIASFLSVPVPQTYQAVALDEQNNISLLQPINSINLYIDGGFFIFRQEFFHYINDGEEILEQPFQRLLKENKLITYKYTHGFFQPMDTWKEKKGLDEMVHNQTTPWQQWTLIQNS
ncbi:MAG: glucose-1-phosphate cytidylyltransferase, partial [bacterium]|nr:glucose-1-phosphate cytidylyltransferase [bacterium]